jgi:hypothetical protein
MHLWAFQTQCDLHELVIVSKEIIAATKDTLVLADRMIARK